VKKLVHWVSVAAFAGMSVIVLSNAVTQGPPNTAVSPHALQLVTGSGNILAVKVIPNGCSFELVAPNDDTQLGWQNFTGVAARKLCRPSAAIRGSRVFPDNYEISTDHQLAVYYRVVARLMKVEEFDQYKGTSDTYCTITYRGLTPAAAKDFPSVPLVQDKQTCKNIPEEGIAAITVKTDSVPATDAHLDAHL